MVSSGESARIKDCSKVVLVAALSQEVPIKKEYEYQSDDACSLSDVNRYVQGKASVTYLLQHLPQWPQCSTA